MGDLESLLLIDEANGAESEILSEDRLRKIGKSCSNLDHHDGDAIEKPPFQVQQLRLDLLHTAKSSHLSPSHGAAALNALCRFLDICSTCQNKSWSSLCFSPSTCKDLIHIVLDRSEGFKAKPAKQLLVTLSNILAAYPEEGLKTYMIGFVVNRCVRSLLKREDAKSIKSSMQTLEHLMKKGVITAMMIVLASMYDQPAPVQISREMMPEKTQSNIRLEIEDFITYVLDWIRYPDCASAISRFLPSFLASLDMSPATSLAKDLKTGLAERPFWIEPVRRVLIRDIGMLDSFENQVLPRLLCLSIWDRNAFLTTLPFDDLQKGQVGRQSDPDIHLCLLAAKVMTSNPHLPGASNMLAMKLPGLDALCINLTNHTGADIRIAAFSVLISSFRTTAPLPSNVLFCLRQCIPNFHQETTPKIRNEFIILIKRLCSRLANAAKNFTRLSAEISMSSDSSAGPDENLMQHIDMIRWYSQYLWHELRPTASYQSHITALKILPFIFGDSSLSEVAFSKPQYSESEERSGMKSEREVLLAFLRPLLDLLANPFDDIRLSASEILDLLASSTKFAGWMERSNASMDDSLIDSEFFQTKLVRQVETAVAHAENNLQMSGRADHADGLGRLYKFYYGITKNNVFATIAKDKNPLNTLLYKLEQSLQIIRQDAPSDFTSFPLHGQLIALRHIISRVDFIKSFPEGNGFINGQNFHTRLLACCNDVWNLVHSVLCFDAPEGRLMYTDEDDEDDDASNHKSKDMLSFCWRALKESSLLMRAVVDCSSSVNETTLSEIHEGDYRTYGRLVFTQLVELRHRGAFSTVAQTFAVWCVTCSRSELLGVNSLPKEWYQEALACIHQQASALTRRSAGLPAVLTGILAAYPGGPFFDDVILDLQAIADAPTKGLGDLPELRLPQIHALNCLKDIFVDSRFGTSTEDHITLSLDIAVSSLGSNIWAIRNCGLMLLQALLKRLNGGADTTSTRVASLHRQSSPLIYEKFMILPELLLKLLHHRHHEDSSILHAQRVFPALEIIERFGIPKESREIWGLLTRYRDDPLWSIREKAAKTIGMINKPNDLKEQVRSLIYSSTDLSTNEMHGNFMTLRVLLARAMPMYLNSPKSESQLDELFTLLFKIVEEYVTDRFCPIIAVAALNFVTDAVDGLVCLKDKNEVKQAVHRLFMLLSRRQANFDVNSWLPCSKYVSQSTTMSHCLQSLERIVALDDSRVAKNYAPDFVNEPSQMKVALDTAQADLTQLASSPQESDENLRLWGKQIAQLFSETAGATIYFTPWIRALLLAMNAYSEISTRLAAVASIKAFCHRLLESTSDTYIMEIRVELLTILYDALLDDDEDVRMNGANVVSFIVSNDISASTDRPASLSFSPPFAKSTLLKYLSSNHSQSATLVLEGVWRLIGLSESTDVVSRTSLIQKTKDGDSTESSAAELMIMPVSRLFERATYQQNVVFEEEKQNLYVDPVTEAETWAQVIIDAQADAWPVGLMDALRVWTESGLKCLFIALNESTDSPLGLTSKAEVYALFMQVILMARVLLRSLRAPDPQRRDIETVNGRRWIFESLENLSECGQKRDLHPLILDRIHRILREVGNITE